MFFKVICQIQGHMGPKHHRFWSELQVSDCSSTLNSPMTQKGWIKLNVVKKRCPIVFRGHPLNFKIILDRNSPILTRIESFMTVFPVWIYPWLWNAWCSIEEVACCCSRSSVKFQGHAWHKNRFWPEMIISRLQLQFELTNGFEMKHYVWRSVEEVPVVVLGHPSKFKVTRAEKSTIWIQFE